MLTLLLILLVTGIALAVSLYVGAMFLQGYIYTEPSQQLYWQAPAAGGVLMVFLMVWCTLVAKSDDTSTRDIPYDTLFHFSPRVDLLKEPAKEIWAVYKDGMEKPYERDRINQTAYRYVYSKVAPKRPWRDDGVASVKLVIEREPMFFKRAPGAGSYGEYISDLGWVMKDYGDGPTGQPSMFRWGRFLMNLFLNFGFFLAWWLCLWLLLRFQWSHAFGLGLVLWLAFTLIVLPILLNYAAEVAQR